MLDWVPGHFPDDPHGLGHFDGTALYEHADPMQGRHLDWDTLIYNFGRTRSRQFPGLPTRCSGSSVTASTACASMRSPRCSISTTAGPRASWIPNKHGGRENLEAVDFLRRFNTEVFGRFPQRDDRRRGIDRMAAGVAPGRIRRARLRLQVEHGLDARHAALCRQGSDPPQAIIIGDILFGLHYAFSENFILPLSHDEVVHGKRSILGRMPGDDWQRFANLRAYYGFMFGTSRQEADVHGLRVRPGARMESRSVARLASPRPDHDMPASRR